MGREPRGERQVRERRKAAESRDEVRTEGRWVRVGRQAREPGYKTAKKYLVRVRCNGRILSCEAMEGAIETMRFGVIDSEPSDRCSRGIA